MNAAAWGADVFVIVTEDGRVWTGPDWEVQTLSGTPMRDVTWTGDRFAAVGDGGALWTSSDGKDWSGTSIADNDLHGIAAAAGTIVIVGDEIALHGDPDDWAEVAVPAVLRDITFADGQWVAAAVPDMLWVSPDAVNWAPTLGGGDDLALTAVAAGIVK